MKIEIIAGSAFVRTSGKTLPYHQVLAELHSLQSECIAGQATAAAQLNAARSGLALALAEGTAPDRIAIRAAETALDAARERLAAVRAQLLDLQAQHAVATNTQRLAEIKTDLSRLSRTFETAIKRISA